MSEENVEIVRRLYNSAWKPGDLDLLCEVEWLAHSPPSGPIKGLMGKSLRDVGGEASLATVGAGLRNQETVTPQSSRWLSR